LPLKILNQKESGFFLSGRVFALWPNFSPGTGRKVLPGLGNTLQNTTDDKTMLGLPDRGGKELGGEEVGNGEGGGDEKLAGHGQGEDHPHLCHHGGTLRPRQKSSVHKK
jgi:hypothetical protein